jgi:MFS family permease
MSLTRTSNEARVLAATAIASAMAFVDMTAVNTALPLMQQALGASVTDAQWIMEIYILFLSALLLTGGALGDRFGGAVLARCRRFVLASLACGLSQTVSQVIIAWRSKVRRRP